jgi:asparagine synthase (glutamine-hydrolysing)
VCGIAGRLNFRTGAPVDPGILHGMGDLLAHRGPDGEGFWHQEAVGLAHRRLAIVDLSDAARQPMTAEDPRVRVVCNGEIYNFRELRMELESRGHRFRTRSDTEVLLAAYAAYGLDCLSRLRGMFAFALWDGGRRRLLLARDRTGKKPLYYRLDGDGIAFASEPKAFLADPSFEARPDVAALSDYLTYHYVPAPGSAFAGVRRVPPAHYLVVEDGQVRLERYWRLRYQPKRQLSEGDAAAELLARLRDAVRCRLVADVPLGAFLSGGIDSSTVVALMAEAGAAPVRTFSIGFEEREYDELPYARLVARRYGTDHHEFVVRPEAVDVLPRLVWHYNEPYADSSAIPTFYLAELTRRHVTVALNGDGGDENLAGYRRHLAGRLAERYAGLARPLQRPLAALLAAVPAPGRGMAAYARRFLAGLGDPPARRYARWASHLDPALKWELTTEEFRRAAGDRDSLEHLTDAFRHAEGSDLIDATLAGDVETYLPDDLLVKVDIATMAHGLEGRSPFLDHDLMEFCASLPSDLKLHGLTTKYLLKRALRGLLPAPVIDRPKQGFAVPIDRWLRGELRTMAHDVLLDARTLRRGYFHERVVRRLLEEHGRGVRGWHAQLWSLLVLELWHRMFVDRRPAAAPPLVPVTVRGAATAVP